MQQAQPQLAVDPNLAAEQAQAAALQTQQLQTESQGDTAAIMARYGTRVALGGAVPSNYTAPPMAAH